MTGVGGGLFRAARRWVTRTPVVAPPPVVSVIVPVYDVEDYLAEALASLAAQTYPYLEVLVVDDGSTDGSLELARRLTDGDPRFTVVPARHGGLGATRNKGLALATGTYVTFMDSDDIVPPDAYAAMVASLEESGSGMVLGNVERFDSRRAWIPGWARAVHGSDVSGATLGTLPAAMRDILACNRMYRRSFWDARVGVFPEGVVFEDHAPMLRSMLRDARFDVLARVTYRWRRREDRSSLSQPKEELANLAHRVRAKADAWDILTAEGTDAEKALWLARVLDLDLVPYLGHGATSSPGYQDLLATTVTTYLERAAGLTAQGHDVVGGVRGHRRLAAWYASQRDWAALGSLTADLEAGRPPRARPGTDSWRLDDGARAQRASALPAWLRDLPAAAVAPVLTVVRVTWGPADLVVRGTLSIRGADVAPEDVVLRAGLGGQGAVTTVLGPSPRRADAAVTGTDLEVVLTIGHPALVAALPAAGAATLDVVVEVGPQEHDVEVVAGSGTRAPRPRAEVLGRALLQPTLTADHGLSVRRSAASCIVEDVVLDDDVILLRLDPAPADGRTVVLGTASDGYVLDGEGGTLRLPVGRIAVAPPDAALNLVTADRAVRVLVPSALGSRLPRGLVASARAGLHAVPGARIALTRLEATEAAVRLELAPVGLADPPAGAAWTAVLRDGDTMTVLPTAGDPPRSVTFGVPRRTPAPDATMAPTVASCRLTLTAPGGEPVPLVVSPEVLDAQPASPPSGAYDVRVVARDGGIELRVEHLEVRTTAPGPG